MKLWLLVCLLVSAYLACWLLVHLGLKGIKACQQSDRWRDTWSRDALVFVTLVSLVGMICLALLFVLAICVAVLRLSQLLDV